MKLNNFTFPIFNQKIYFTDQPTHVIIAMLGYTNKHAETTS